MGLFDAAADDLTRRQRGPDDAADADGDTPADTVEIDGTRAIEVTVAGETVTIDDPDTTQPDDEGTWLTGTDAYGRPRGTDALEHRQIVQTSAMQSITNGIADQILGGELVFRDKDDILDDLGESERAAAERLKTTLRDVLTGPHLQRESLDDLITAAVEDMLGPGNAYWQTLGAANADVPVVALSTLDPLTIRRNVDRHGVFGEPPFWQANSAFGGGTVGTLGSIDPVPLEHDDLLEFTYPRGHRSYKFYPVSASWQVKEWLEILANSTTHHNRFYSDNEHASGLLQVINASTSTINNIRDEIQEAAGDPRKVALAGGESAANWIEMGGTAVNLDIIQEQQWFFELCLGSLGLGKAEVGLIEDVNRSNGEIEADRVYKRIAGPFIDQFAEAFMAIARQFDAYRNLGEPFEVTIAHSDPRAERAREERLLEEYQQGKWSLKQLLRRTGNEDIAGEDDRFEITVGGETINYADHPKWVVQAVIADARDGGDTDQSESEPGEGEQAVTLGAGAGGAPRTNGGGGD